MMSVYEHQPVLLEQVLAALNINPDGIYIDATFGRGGHTRAILERLSSRGRVLAFDQDPEAIAYGHEQFADENRLVFEHCNFSQLEGVVVKHNLAHRVNGVLMDLGVSSPQLDDATRGFSFSQAGPLDMRMNPHQGLSAKQWLATVDRDELSDVLKRYGEERFAKRIAQAIVTTREQREINDTKDLADIISAAVPVKDKHKHPATRSFQAIRIYINNELQSVEEGIKGAANILATGGRLVVISFHSLEDRLVKRFMRAQSTRKQLPRELPVMDDGVQAPFRVVGKAISAGPNETKINPRARSAHLRVLERIR